MSNLKEAAQQAIEALEHVTESETFYHDPRGDRAGQAIDTLRAALAQPDDKAPPVATYQGHGADQIQELLAGLEGLTYGTKLYAAPQPPAERQCTCHPDDSPPRPCAGQYAVTECKKVAEQGAELSDEEIKLVARKTGIIRTVPTVWLIDFARAVIAADRAARGGAA